MSKQYITTTLPYVNAEPHIGFALEIIEADAWSRFRRLIGDEVVFNTGTDEHGMKLYRKAVERGLDAQTYVDEYAAKFHRLKEALNLSYTNFIRTTDHTHIAAAQAFWLRCYERGSIYKKTYQVKYCVGCELEKTDSELVDDACPIHPSYHIELINEENYFFRFSHFQDALLDLYAHTPDFVQPAHRLKEIKNFVENGLADFSISRLKAKMPWGVPVPNDPEHVMYVWFDALVNYISTLGWPQDEQTFNAVWPGIQICGKDNLRQQAAMWQAMLFSVGLPAARRIYVHGFITVDGQKMSKSVGNVIDPIEVSKSCGTDALRYFLLREIPFGEDGDFSYARLHERYANDLANTLGNLLNRVISMSRKYFDGQVPPIDPAHAETPRQASAWAGRAGLGRLRDDVAQHYDNLRFDAGLTSIWNGSGAAERSGLAQANKYVEETQPFKLMKTDPEAAAGVLYALLEACRWYAWLLAPVMPQTSSKILEQLGLETEHELKKSWHAGLTWGGLPPGQPLPKAQPLFPKINTAFQV